MSTSLALISGKGGSGKTTIALSISEILASCNKKILYVDCDMSTHGATYFFEPYITDKENILTTSDFFLKRGDKSRDVFAPSKNILNVAKNIDFIPSCVDFSKPFFEDSSLEFLFDEYDFLKDGYDLIIFDCQAGYSLVTDRVLDVTDYNLVVMEEDAISSSAVRVLHTQLSRQLNNSKTFQVFNKLSDSDYKLYEKITNGTLFTNLTPVMFDWSVKRAFIAHDLPEINEHNPILTENIYKLLCEILPMFKKDLEKYIIVIKEKLISEINNDIYKNKCKRRKISRQKYTPIIPLALCLPLIIILLFKSSSFDLILYLCVILIVFISIIWLAASIPLSKSTKEEIYLKDEQYALLKQLKMLQKDIGDIRAKNQTDL